LLRLVLFGAPGAGKGTQAQLLNQQLGIPHISSGDLFRHHLRGGTPLGLRAAQYINQGVLVPDEVTIDIVLEKVMSVPREGGFILDGFPRNLNQAQALEEALAHQSLGLDKIIYINVPEAELTRRLGGRFTCRQCQAPHTITHPDTGATLRCQRCGGELYQRPDDNPVAVQTRIQVYQKETLPLLDFYQRRGLLVDIPGVGSIEAVNQRVLSALGQGALGSTSGTVSKVTNPE
jgi:adenylate kinase